MRVFGGPCWTSGEARVGQGGDVLQAQWSRPGRKGAASCVARGWDSATQSSNRL